MFWIIIFLLLSSSPFCPYLLMKEPARPSPGFLCYLDRAFVDWTSRLVHKGLLDDGHWLLECPGYLCGCCPTVNKLDADHEVLNQLTDLTPVHAFAYALTRRIAEVVVKLSSCWTLAGLVFLLIFSVWRTWQASYRQNSRERGIKGSSPTWWSPKNVCMLFSTVLLSILAPTLAEKAFGGVVDYQMDIMSGKSANSPSFSVLKPWKVRNVHPREYMPLSVLHLLDFVRLHRSLYGPSVSHASTASALCRQTALSLSCWSTLVFVGTAYAVVAATFRVLVWKPVRCLFSGLTKHKDNICERRRSLIQAERDHLFETCSQEIVDPFAKRSDSAVQFNSAEEAFSPKINWDVTASPHLPVSEDEVPHPLPVRPRYVTRGVYACLDDEEYALRD